MVSGAALALANGAAFAQATIVIGGSGQANVIVNLDVLYPSNRSASNAPGRRILRMPGETISPGGILKLRMPSGMAAASAATGAFVLRAPKLKLKPPAMPMARKKTPRPAAKVARVSAAPLAKAAPAAPRQITKPAPVAPKAPIMTAPVKAPPSPPPPPVVKKPPLPPVVKKPPATQTATKPKPVAAPKPRRGANSSKQVASLPPVKRALKKGVASRVRFTGSSTRLSSEAKILLRDLARQIATRGDRLQLKAYAGGTNDSSSSARRLSLSRALAVRAFLIESGVRSTRIDVRALGRAADSGPPDRVDMILLVR
jgi:outer membrane protein OmpA-like peptidoglycan-associated protein